jgi:hypothetical protein
VITRHGKPAGVLIGFESEDDWLEYRLQNDPRFLKRVDDVVDKVPSLCMEKTARHSASPLERSLDRRSFIAVGIGVAVLWLTQWGQPKVVELLLHSPMKNFPFLRAATLGVLLALVSLLPGFCAGVISGRRGILLGMLTGLIGGMTYSVLFFLIRLHFLHLGHFSTSAGALLWFWGSGPGLLLTCAAGGAAGQLLRSNNRWSGP